MQQTTKADRIFRCFFAGALRGLRVDYIIELLGHCKGGYFNIHIWAWFGYFICSKREIRFYFKFGEELISSLNGLIVRPFHEYHDRTIYSELTFINS